MTAPRRGPMMDGVLRPGADARRPVVAVRTAAAAGILVVGLSVAGALARVPNHDVPGTDFVRYWPLLVVGGVAYGATGGWLATVRPRLRLGWLLLTIGAALAISDVGAEYAIAVVDRHPGWPGASVALWLGVWLWAAGYLVAGLVLPLVLPDGRLASRRHRPLLGAALLAILGTSVLFAVTPYDQQQPVVDLGGLSNPTARGWYDAPWLQGPLTALTLGCLVAGVVVLLRRWYGAGDDRAALSVVVLGMLVTVVIGLSAFPAPSAWEPALGALAAVPLPVACVVAVLRHGLWDVDVVLSRALAFTALSALAAGAYVVLVGVLGGVVGSTTGLPVLVTAVVALLAIPAYRRLQRLVNRLVHGDAEDPYAALARLGEQLEAARDPAEVGEQVLPEVVAAVARALRAPAALALRDGSVVTAGDVRPEPLRVPLSYAGETQGELRLGARPDGLSRSERRLLDGLSRQTAVAVHGVLLGRDLQHSRELLVSAREEERRRLRRDLHDGVGPALAAAALQVETAREVYARDPAAAAAMLDRAALRLRGAVDDVRAVVHGLRPATLDDLGLPDALVELAARFEAPGRRVTATVADVPGRTAAVDAAAYLVAAEALANAARHAAARHVELELAAGQAGLVLTVTDDGVGLRPGAGPGAGPGPRPGLGLRSMRERAEELAGTLTVGTGPIGGTRVSLWLPVEAT